MNTRTRSRSSIGSKVLLVAACAAIAFVTRAIVRETQRRQAVAQEIQAIVSEVQRLEQQRARLTDLIQAAETPEFLEREARLRLGLQKPGETVLIVPEGAGGAAGSNATISSPPPSSKSNAVKWWQRLFR